MIEIEIEEVVGWAGSRRAEAWDEREAGRRGGSGIGLGGRNLTEIDFMHNFLIISNSFTIKSSKLLTTVSTTNTPSLYSVNSFLLPNSNSHPYSSTSHANLHCICSNSNCSKTARQKRLELCHRK